MFKCSECNNVYSSREALKMHVKKKHPDKVNLNDEEKQNFKCSVCGNEYITYSALKLHAKKKHPNEVDVISPNLKQQKIFKHTCDHCARKFNSSYEFNYHMKRTHNTTNTIGIELKCPLCSYKSSNIDMHKHFEVNHDLKVEIVDLNFDNFKEFKMWKDSTEKETKCKFVSKRPMRRLKKGGSKQTFVCHRSGFYIPGGKGIRHLKTQESCKIGAYCPAKIIAFESETGECNVKFYKTHIGHENDIGHLYLTEFEGRILATKITSKQPLTDIPDETRDSVNDSNSERILLLKGKELQNTCMDAIIKWNMHNCVLAATQLEE